MNIGSLYTGKKWSWLLFPRKETATAAAASSPGAAGAAPDAAPAADFWSKQLNCNVTYFSPDSYIVFLEEDTKVKKVLTSTGKLGWVWFDESYNHWFEEVKTEQ